MNVTKKYNKLYLCVINIILNLVSSFCLLCTYIHATNTRAPPAWKDRNLLEEILCKIDTIIVNWRLSSHSLSIIYRCIPLQLKLLNVRNINCRTLVDLFFCSLQARHATGRMASTILRPALGAPVFAHILELPVIADSFCSRLSPLELTGGPRLLMPKI